MERKEFLVMMGGVPLLGRSSIVAGPDTLRPRIESVPESEGERARYSLELLHILCDRIGPRMTGTIAMERAAQILKREMGRSLPEVFLDRYRFGGWELIEAPDCSVGHQPIEIWPSHGSASTPPEGFEGVLVRREGTFFLTASAQDAPLASFRVSSYGRAIPSFQRPEEPPAIPAVGVGRQDLPFLENAVRKGFPVRLKSWSRYRPQAPGVNVIGRLPGRTSREILFIAHADSVYSSPGANDNMASVIAMILLAHEASRRRWNHTLTFVAADGEEYGYEGAWNYANSRKAEGTLERIDVVVNFDSLTYGPNLWINSLDDALSELIRSIHEELGLDTRPRFDSRDGFVMDSLPFRPSGARAMHVNSRGYDEKTLPVYHRPDDTARKVPLDCVELAFRVFIRFLERIDVT